MRIAVPVEGENLKIVKRTGEAPFFALFNDTLFEKIVAAPRGHGDDHHDHEHLDDEAHVKSHGKSVASIADCGTILVQAIGPHMKEAIERHEITIVKIRQKEGEYAPEAVENFLKGQADENCISDR